MNNQYDPKINRLYLYTILLLMAVLPVVSIVFELCFDRQALSIALICKWFIFWGVGVRLLTAGLRQVIKPAFTAHEIFHIQSEDSHIIVRELGFANICFGLLGVLSIVVPGLRLATAFTGGLYMGIAGINHIIKKSASPNEVLAMVSDLFIFLVTAVYLWGYLCAVAS